MLQREAPSRVAASPARTDCSALPGQVRLSPLGEQPRGHLAPDIWGFLQQGGPRVLICYGLLAPWGVRNYCNHNRNTPGGTSINCPPGRALWNSLVGWTLKRRGLWERMAPQDRVLRWPTAPLGIMDTCVWGTTEIGLLLQLPPRPQGHTLTPGFSEKHWLACRPVRAVSRHRVVPQTHLIYSRPQTSASAASSPPPPNTQGWALYQLGAL